MEKHTSRYKVISENGSILRALDTTTQTQVLIQKHFRRPFLTSAKLKTLITILKTIRHKRILPFICLDENCAIDDSKVYGYAVYECRGTQSLQSYVEGKGKLSESEGRHIIRQLVAGYEELSRCCVVHGNVDPQSVIMVNEKKAEVALWNYGIVDEQAESGCAVLGVQNDIWGIGALLNFMLNGVLIKKESGLFDEASMTQSISFHCLEFMKGCMERKPQMRFTFEEMAAHPFILYNTVKKAKAPNVSFKSTTKFAYSISNLSP
eukprot:TRINITY_DN10616_c0_g6_i1.p1 TRINITY_DN10616_c0_g6~~TRINITY_DN10616_c0_g6_i1.p1  ORF type:complete len:264 (+),score=52.13 TRINITY_DN10616_c0_g6_i1:179-970(+)